MFDGQRGKAAGRSFNPDERCSDHAGTVTDLSAAAELVPKIWRGERRGARRHHGQGDRGCFGRRTASSEAGSDRRSRRLLRGLSRERFETVALQMGRPPKSSQMKRPSTDTIFRRHKMRFGAEVREGGRGNGLIGFKWLGSRWAERSSSKFDRAPVGVRDPLTRRDGVGIVEFDVNKAIIIQSTSRD